MDPAVAPQQGNDDTDGQVGSKRQRITPTPPLEENGAKKRAPRREPKSEKNLRPPDNPARHRQQFGITHPHPASAFADDQATEIGES